MIIGDVEKISCSEVHVKVNYTVDEAKILNKELNCLTDMQSWITFVVVADSVDKYTDCEITKIRMFTSIENKEYKVPSTLFSDGLIIGVMDAADKIFSGKASEHKKPEGFILDGDYSAADVEFPAPYTAKNSDLYFGCTKYDE